MQPIGLLWDFSWFAYDPNSAGYFDAGDQNVPTVSPGQPVYYRVDLTYPVWFGTYVQSSMTLKLTAGGGAYSVPSTANLKFPLWPEWPEPWWRHDSSTPTNQVRAIGETFTLTNRYLAYTDFGIPRVQWRKDGKIIPGATNLVQMSGDAAGDEYQTSLTITNTHVADAGVYDVEVFGDQWLVSPKITLPVQSVNCPGAFTSAHLIDDNLVCELRGIAGRRYQIQRSSDLVVWNDCLTVTNLTGTITITNPVASANSQFFRAILLP